MRGLRLRGHIAATRARSDALDPLPVTLFADFASAASYLTETALRRRARAGDLAVVFRAGEAGDDAGGEEVQRLAAELGLSLDPPALPPETGKAHELARFARERGLEEATRAALYRAYWEEGADIGRIDLLQELAGGVGLDPFEVRVALDIDRHREEVLRDRELARRLGVRRLPVLYLGTGPRAGILTGPLSPEALDEAIARHRRAARGAG